MKLLGAEEVSYSLEVLEVVRQITAEIAHEPRKLILSCLLPMPDPVRPPFAGQDVRLVRVDLQAFAVGNSLEELLSRFDRRTRNDKSDVVNVSKITPIKLLAQNPVEVFEKYVC